MPLRVMSERIPTMTLAHAGLQGCRMYHRPSSQYLHGWLPNNAQSMLLSDIICTCKESTDSSAAPPDLDLGAVVRIFDIATQERVLRSVVDKVAGYLSDVLDAYTELDQDAQDRHCADQERHPDLHHPLCLGFHEHVPAHAPTVSRYIRTAAAATF